MENSSKKKVSCGFLRCTSTSELYCNCPGVFNEATRERRVLSGASKLLPVILCSGDKRQSAQGKISVIRDHLVSGLYLLRTLPPSHHCSGPRACRLALQSHLTAGRQVMGWADDPDVKGPDCETKEILLEN
ncbi:hypothetical protein TNIN_243991 [Trichonephila inaurata madagascariensis]|uniref:Uncharacterized protein n=1 Tax=Trichonephila inaurata madagascariensis TaxID=2747483 RepID=A0A8X6WU89_9ARAC|nr:hypothetical protein TNIN_243991 [Trichonephila inaurata madagascariensis]